MRPQPSLPVVANFDSRHLTIASGAAIFHVKSERIVLCYHSRDKYYFLPKGRRDVNEESGAAAQREGFEESGYPNRLLPLPVDHRQPYAHDVEPETLTPFSTEPVWTQLIPLSSRRQYMLFWYICETLPPEDEAAFLLARSSQVTTSATAQANSQAWQQGPVANIPAYPLDLTLEERVLLEPGIWQPTKVEGTGVDEEEALYVSGLYTIPRALELLRGSLGVEIVRKGWELIQLRKQIEQEIKEKVEMART